MKNQPRFHPDWLTLREEADAAARSRALARAAGRVLATGAPAGGGSLVIVDLGCGTGAMGRWLAPHLAGQQHWVCCDRDPRLLARASATTASSADGTPVTVAVRRCEMAALTAADLAGASLVTTSALLDLLTAGEVDRLAAACAHLACPALLTLSVTGQVWPTPPDPLDPEITAAFNDHQRRRAHGRRLLGPDAVDAAARAFGARGARVAVAASPWRLGPSQAALTATWLRGWVAAACQQRPELGAAASGYLERRLAATSAGRLRVVVEHRDLLATWPQVAQASAPPARLDPPPNRSDSA